MAQDMFFSKNYTLNLRGDLIDLSSPKVMGILNITPDSFFEASRVPTEKELLKKAEKMIFEGSDILDLGAYSTRPGARDISVNEEIERLVPAVEAIRKNFNEIYISADTFRSEVAKAAVEAGADLINDVAGGNLDKNMFETVAHLQVPYVLMHMRGTPSTMQSLTHYTDLTQEILEELALKKHRLMQLGVNDVLIDPGFGFAKTIEQNFELMRNLTHFHQLEAPLLIGVSRKSMVYKTLGTTAENALDGTTVLHAEALRKGASILRVHDVAAAVNAIKIGEQLW